MRDVFTEIWATARRNKLRTALTGFAVAWGIFMIIFLLGEGNGLINAQMMQGKKFLANSMVIGAGQTAKAYNGLKEGRAITLNDKDMQATGREFDANVETVGAELEQPGVTVTLGSNYFSGSLMGVYPNEVSINKKEMTHGRFINQLDINEDRKALVIGSDDARELVRGDISQLVGQYVKLNGMSFRVVGIYKTEKTGMGNNLFTSFTAFRKIFGRGNETGNIVFTTKGLSSYEENEQFEKQYRARINRNHMAAPDDEGSIWIWNRITQSMDWNKGISMTHTALWVIGLFTLLSGIVGVSNIMLITVKERTREFGIRKAIGASPASILRLVIVESVIITTFFGYIGMVIGVAANEYMDMTMGNTTVDSGLFQAVMFYNPTVGIDVCLQLTMVMIIAGTLAGFVPARKAAHIKPIEALNDY